MRIGITTGTRLPMRKISTCVMARKRRKQSFQNLIVQSQRIAAGNNYFPDLWCCGNIADHLLQPRFFKPIFPGCRPVTLPVAMPAIGSANFGDNGEAAVGIAMHQLGHRHMGVFFQRVGLRLQGRGYFPDIRETLCLYRIWTLWDRISEK